MSWTEQIIWFLFGAACLALVLYAIMVVASIIGWKRIGSENSAMEEPGISVLIAARNEASNIGTAISDMLRQHYPPDRFEVIVIDDHSDDSTFALSEALVKQHSMLTVLRNDIGQGKKSALQTGMATARFPLIATMDADCRTGPEWLAAMANQWVNGRTRMLLGPVVLSPAAGFLQRMQSLEMLAIMGLTGGSAQLGKPIMANGANILFDRASFDAVGGYEDNGNPSGDDVFTMLKISRKWSGSVAFVKDHRAIVQTDAQPDLSSFWQQRKRWLSKKSSYADSWVKASGVITYAANASGLASIVGIVISVLYGANLWADRLLWILFIKLVLDLILIRTVKKDLQPTCGIWEMFPAELFVISYVTLLGLFGNVGRYKWKGRSINVDGRR